jgi:hypothetical protein
MPCVNMSMCQGSEALQPGPRVRQSGKGNVSRPSGTATIMPLVSFTRTSMSCCVTHIHLAFGDEVAFFGKHLRDDEARAVDTVLLQYCLYCILWACLGMRERERARARGRERESARARKRERERKRKRERASESERVVHRE